MTDIAARKSYVAALLTAESGDCFEQQSLAAAGSADKHVAQAFLQSQRKVLHPEFTGNNIDIFDVKQGRSPGSNKSR